MNYLDKEFLAKQLTAVQLDAVLYTENPSLILAGAGSGKTRVLIFKIAYLISIGQIQPQNILAVTFTNRAAKEMRSRLESYLNCHIHMPWLGTFHSICVRLLRQLLPEFPQGKLPSRQFSIFDDDDQKKVLRQIFKESGDDFPAIDAKRARGMIGHYKSNLISPEEAAASASYNDETQLAEVYKRYEAKLLANNALDFDDLLILTVKLLEKDPELKGRLRKRFQYIFVDEYQDTNQVQYRLIKLLCNPQNPRITVVGDDDQSIYRWRGADIAIIRNFANDFQENVQIFKLEENFRSTQNIVQAAGSVIKHNRRSEEMEKHVFSNQKVGDPVKVNRVSDDYSEAEYISAKIAALGVDQWSHTAVFYRTNAQSRILETVLTRNRIPFRIYGGVGFYQRAEIKDIFAYLRLIVNPDDEISLQRVINVPRRGIGKTTVDRLLAESASTGVSAGNYLRQVQSVAGAARTKLVNFANLLDELRSNYQNIPLPVLIERVVQITGYRDALIKEGKDESRDRLNNIDELLNDVEEREEAQPGITLEEYLLETSLSSTTDESSEEGSFVRLMTLHAAKGLEFTNVFIAGVDDFLLPMNRSDDPEQEEEERRLFYVGCTRAMERLTLMSASVRKVRGRDELFRISRFIGEMDEQVCEYSPSREGVLGFQSREFSWQNEDENIPEWKRRARAQFSSAPKSETSRSEFEDISQENLYLTQGSLVAHPRFGRGIVIGASGSDPNARVEIRFDSGETKKLVLKFANLKVIG